MKEIISRDGTTIAYDQVGEGSPVILITGASATRSSFDELAKLLSTNFTVYSYDRRGRGDSTDTEPYSIEKEIEDIDVLIDEAGGDAYLYGISSGASLALEAASKLGDKVIKLALYEAPYDESQGAKEIWIEYTTSLKAALAAGDRGQAAVLFLKFVGVPEEMINGMKNSPMWEGMEEVAPTLAYDAACMGEDRMVPTTRAAMITAPTLVMNGDASFPFMAVTAEKLSEVIPDSTLLSLDKQTHDVSAKILAPVLKDFFSEEE